ncbi:MAG: signal peptide peptidase SppA [Myxococcaceae bacterium]|nr:signal peptide peptidase SppA [Myxococcaceae bacterium]
MSDPTSPDGQHTLPPEPPPAPIPQPQPRPVGLPPAPKKKSSSLILLIGCGAFLGLGLLGTVAIATAGASASVDDGAVLRMKLSGDIPEYLQTEGLDELFGPKPVTVQQHVFNLKKAAVDKRIKGVVLELEPLIAGPAKLEELRDAVLDFKKSGKFVIAWSEFMTEREYALAVAADSIVMPKDSRFEFNGFATDLAHYPGLLEKLGVEVQYFRYGQYKSGSGEQLGRKAFTEPVKQMISSNLERSFAHFIDAVATNRKLDAAAVRALVDEAGEKSDWALEKKLIDRLAYWDEVEDDLRTRTGLEADEKVKFITSSKYRTVSGSRAGLPEGKHTFALIYSVGLIVAGKGGIDPFSGGASQGSDAIIKSLRKAVEDDDVKAIIFRVDSPGGAGLGCDYVRREVEKARAKKPVIVSMSDVAASGGYWVSMDATAIVAQPSTYTGSIGIFAVVPNLGPLYEKLDLNNETFKAGQHADAVIGARKMTDDEAKAFDDNLLASYKRFVELAAKGRNKTYEALEPVAQGRTWLGDEALEKGLVDKLGGVDAAVALGKEKAGLPADEPVKLELFTPKKTFVQALLEQEEDDEVMTGVSTLVLQRAIEAAGARPLLRRAPHHGAFSSQVLAGERVFPLMDVSVDPR